MAEEIITSPEESVSMEAPIAEAPIESTEEVVDVQPTPSKGLQNLQKLHSLLVDNDVYSKITPERFDDFVNKYRDPIKLKKLHSLLVENDVYSKIMPADLNEAAEKYGFGGLGKPSAVPSPSASGGSATKGRGAEQPSTSYPTNDKELIQYRKENLEQVKKALAGDGAFPETFATPSYEYLKKIQPPGMDLSKRSIIETGYAIAGKTLKEAQEQFKDGGMD